MNCSSKSDSGDGDCGRCARLGDGDGCLRACWSDDGDCRRDAGEGLWVGTGVWCADTLEVGDGIGEVGSRVGFETVDDDFGVVGSSAETLCICVIFALGNQVEPCIEA